MQQWIDGKIEDTTTRSRRNRPNSRELREKSGRLGDRATMQALVVKIAKAYHDAELNAARRRAALGLRSSQTVHRRLSARQPVSETLVLITGLLFLGTSIKDLFLVANNVLVARLSQLATFDLRNMFYRRTLRMDLATFGEDGTADLMSRFTNDVNQVAGASIRCSAN